MSVKDELLFDFSVNVPRVLVCGDLVIIDNVKRIVMFTDKQIIVHNGKKYTSVEGNRLSVTEMKDGRMLIAGEPKQIRLFETL